MKLKVAYLILLSMLLNSISSNSFAWNIGDVFSGMSTNVTAPGSYQDQAAGHYFGGGFSMRTKNSSLQPFSVTPPELKMGCGGIDMYTGSFSIIKDGRLVETAKRIGSELPSYGFQLALKSYAPVIENTLSKLRDLAMDLNGLALNDCQAMQSIFATGLPKDSAMYEEVCKDLANQGGGDDYFGARKNCSDNKKAREAAQKHQQNSGEVVLLDNFNLFLIAAKKAKIPDDMLEATMTIAGTVVVKDGKRTFYDSLATDQDTFTAHLKGGKATSVKCDNTNSCLNISIINNDNISAENSYQGKAKTKLQGIKTKMHTNVAFTGGDKDFLTSIGDTFPIYNYLSLEVVTGASILDKSSDLVANYMILHYLSRVITEVKQWIHLLEGKQINDQHFKDYLLRLDRVQDIINEKGVGLTDLAHKTEERSRFIEKHHMAKIR